MEIIYLVLFFFIIHQNMCELVLLMVFTAVEVDDMQHYTFLIKKVEDVTLPYWTIFHTLSL